jgi:hypothetical protein
MILTETITLRITVLIKRLKKKNKKHNFLFCACALLLKFIMRHKEPHEEENFTFLAIRNYAVFHGYVFWKK